MIGSSDLSWILILNLTLFHFLLFKSTVLSTMSMDRSVLDEMQSFMMLGLIVIHFEIELASCLLITNY